MKKITFADIKKECARPMESMIMIKYPEVWG